MRVLILAILSFSVALACSGDCAACHPGLDMQNDIRHIAMKECKVCHTDESLAKINMGDSCGKDCFACHDINSVLSNKNAHGMINSCIKCHMSLNDSFLDKGENIFQKGVKDFSNGFGIK